jgi:putative ABC transport system permease protein
MASFWHDLRYAARTLRKTPAFAAAAVLLLAIGIAATSAMFTLVDAVLVRPLPFADPDRLFMLWESPPDQARNSVSPLNFLDWSEQNRSFSSLAAISGGRRTLTGQGGEPEQVPAPSVSTTFFDVFGVRPLVGRTFNADDNRPGTNVVVLSERFWQRRFGRNASLIGRTITLDDQPATVVGVVPDWFQVLWRADVWTPYVVKRSPEQRRIHYLRIVGRLKPDASLEQARADMAALAAHIAEISPETNRHWGVLVEPLRDVLVASDLRTTSLLFAGAGAFVLLMACANVANLMLARGLARRREIAVRAALGGSRARILGQQAAESLVLASIAGLVGGAVAWAIVRAAPAMMPPDTLPLSIRLDPDLRLTIVATAVTMTTGLLFGLAPAWQAMRVSLVEAIGSGVRASIRGTGALRTALVVGQVATAVLITSGAGLLARTVLSLGAIDPGYREHSVLTMSFGLATARYPTPERALQFFEAVEREVAALPGVAAASIGGMLPLDGQNIGQDFTIVGDPPVDRASQPSAHYQMVGPRYFATLGIDVRRGRAFSDRDTRTSPQVCIVNEEFVRRHLQGRDPIGMRVRISAMDMRGPTPVEREIVGVMRQVKVDGAGEREPVVEVYVPVAQNAWFWSTLVVRTAGDPVASIGAIKAVVARIDKGQPIRDIRTIDEVAARTTALPRFRAALVGALASVALALAAAGIFAVLTLSVSQRRHEIGIRLALGARGGQVLRMVLGGGLRLIGVGIVIGVALAGLLMRSLASLLFGVEPLDPVTFVAAPALLGLVALLACASPAIRAARLSPATTLRHE